MLLKGLLNLKQSLLQATLADMLAMDISKVINHDF